MYTLKPLRCRLMKIVVDYSRLLKYFRVIKITAATVRHTICTIHMHLIKCTHESLTRCTHFSNFMIIIKYLSCRYSHISYFTIFSTDTLTLKFTIGTSWLTRIRIIR